MALDKVESMRTEVQNRRVSEDNQSDHALIEATKHGDEAAFAVIVSRYRSPITNYLYRFLNDYEEAVDLAQETFVRVYFAIDRYHTEFAFSTYIYRIATNLAISEIRKRKRRTLLSLTGLFQSDAEDTTEFQPVDEKALPDNATGNLRANVTAYTINKASNTLEVFQSTRPIPAPPRSAKGVEYLSSHTRKEVN